MIDKFKIFNKVKIDIDKYKQIETNNHEELKLKMEERLRSSQRSQKKRKKAKIITTTAASFVAVVIGVGVLNPSLADNIKENLNEFRSMLDKIRDYGFEDDVAEYDPSLYPELEEEKKENEKNKLIATPIGISNKSNGLEITLDKAMYDKKKIYLDMTLKTDKPFKKSEYIDAVDESPYGDGVNNMYMDNIEIYINDVKHDGYSWGPGVVEFIDEYTVNWIYLIELNVENKVEDANFKIDFNIPKYKNQDFKGILNGNWSFDFNIKAIDDNSKSIDINEKDGEYTLKNVTATETYIEVNMDLPFEIKLGNPHNNFIVVLNDKGEELQMSSGVDGPGKNSTTVYELNNVSEIPKYIDVVVIESYMDLYEPSKYLSSFRVNIEDI